MSKPDSIQKRGVKQCSRKKDCIHPDGPLLPLSEFYLLKRGTRYDSYCKYCRRQIGIAASPQTRKTTSEYSEALAIEKLNSVGIYATTGKASVFDRVDVVAWGCVRIEIKLSNKRSNGRFVFGFENQKDTGISADLVMLIPMTDGLCTFHVFPAAHPVFFTLNDGIKTSVEYSPKIVRRYEHPFKIPLTREIMTEHENAWYLIEVVRLEIQAALLNGGYEPQLVTHSPELEDLLG